MFIACPEITCFFPVFHSLFLFRLSWSKWSYDIKIYSEFNNCFKDLQGQTATLKGL